MSQIDSAPHRKKNRRKRRENFAGHTVARRGKLGCRSNTKKKTGKQCDHGINAKPTVRNKALRGPRFRVTPPRD